MLNNDLQAIKTFFVETNNKELDWLIQNINVLMETQKTLIQKVEYLETGKKP